MIEPEGDENGSAIKEESSDESTVISSQTSTLTRNQGMMNKKKDCKNWQSNFSHLGHDEMQQVVLAMNLQEQLSLCSDDEESDEEDGACGGKSEEIYDDGKFKKFALYKFLTISKFI